MASPFHQNLIKTVVSKLTVGFVMCGKADRFYPLFLEEIADSN